MIHGCGPNIGASALDPALSGCPPVDPRAAAEAKRVVPPPPAGVAVGESAYKDWIDRHELAAARKNAVITSLATDYRRCRGEKL